MRFIEWQNSGEWQMWKITLHSGAKCIPLGCSCVTRFCFGGWFEGGTVWAVLSHGHCKTQPDERLPGLLPKNKK